MKNLPDFGRVRRIVKIKTRIIIVIPDDPILTVKEINKKLNNEAILNILEKNK